MSEALLNAGRQTLMLELQEASRLPERLGDDFVRAANIILHCEGKVVVSGIGKSGHIGKKIAATLASTGTPAFFVHPAEALHGDLGMIESRDVMLFISYSGGAKELDLIILIMTPKTSTLPYLAFQYQNQNCPQASDCVAIVMFSIVFLVYALANIFGDADLAKSMAG